MHQFCQSTTFSISSHVQQGALSPSSPAEDEYKKRHPKVNVGKISRQNRVASQVEIRNKKKQSKLQKRRERHNDFTRDNEYRVIAKDGLFDMVTLMTCRTRWNLRKQNAIAVSVAIMIAILVAFMIAIVVTLTEL